MRKIKSDPTLSTLDQLHWPIGRGNTPWFYLEPTLPRGSRREIAASPCPAYSHDIEEVRPALILTAQSFPIGVPLHYYLATYDGPEGFNGTTYQETDWTEEWKNGGGGCYYENYVVLWGKKVPPHPAMTRYLVAHEYGHCVEDWIIYCRGAAQWEGEKEFRRAYAEVRGIEPYLEYENGQWHRHVAEVIANDFRVLVAGIEKNFWPHPGIPHPETAGEAIRLWWDQAVKEYAVGDL